MLGVIRDITRRKLAEQALVESEKKYRAIMENASDAILLGTMDAWIIDANHRAEELLGYTRNELLQLHGTAIHPKEDHPTLAAAFHDLTAKGSSLYEHLVLRKDGSVINAEVAATIINYQGEKVVMAIFRDTTARKRAEEERLAHAKVQRDTLVREVHHRIKNNLQGVTGLLRQHATKHPELRGPLESAISQVNSIAVVHGLYGQDNSECIILCEMVRAICHATGGLTGKTIEPHVTVDVESPVRVSNEEAVPLALILNELVFNAVKHQAGDMEPIQVYVQDETGGARVRIVTPDTHLPPGFDFSSGQGLGTGLKLVKSLLPPSGCRLRLSDDAAGVVAELQLSPPVLMLPPGT
jgi:PAS domain S-box-containing protein